MPYGVELRFDGDLARRIGDLREALWGPSGAGSPVQGSAIPHLSLAVYHKLEEDETAALAAILDRLAGRWPPAPVALASLGVFPSAQNVLFLAAVVRPDLLALHADYHRRASGLRAACWPYYVPGAWVPHCTLAMWLPSADLLHAIGQLHGAWTPLSGELRSLALIRSEPLETLHEVPLGGRVTRPPGRTPRRHR